MQTQILLPDTLQDTLEGKPCGKVVVNMGDAEGKSTSAFGLVLRAYFSGRSVKIFHFMNAPVADSGEHQLCKQLGIPIEDYGVSLSFRNSHPERSTQLAHDGWQRAKAAILGGEYFMVLLEKITSPVIRGWIPLDEVLQTVSSRPEHVDVVLTGSRCPKEIIELADIVTEMKLIKQARLAIVSAQLSIND